VGARGGASVNFQSRVSKISLHGGGTPGGISLRDRTRGGEEEEEECVELNKTTYLSTMNTIYTN
jgi:hypothetical protein